MPQNFDIDEALRSLQTASQDADSIRRLLREQNVRFLRLQFCDVVGALRHTDVPARQFDRIVDSGLVFDGWSAGPGARIEETDLLLRPDLSTFCVLPWSDEGGRVARLICDVQRMDGSPFEGDPRSALRRVLREISEVGYRPTIGTEVEFFLLAETAGGPPAPDRTPPGLAERVRLEIAQALEAMGIEVGAARPEAAPGQHEIVLRPVEALSAADRLATLRTTVHALARRGGLRATFMPKPTFGHNGSGLHVYHALFQEGRNAFFDPEASDGLSEVLRFYVGGVLQHARGYCAITNPLVNSYKRLVPGYEAPVFAAWALQGNTSLVRIPPRREQRTSCEVRLADPAANPYLALAVQIAAGLDGIRGETDPGAPVGRSSLTGMSAREMQRRRIAIMPQHLGEALDALEQDRVVRGALGEYVYSHFVDIRRAEFEDYLAQVHAWEMERYLQV